MVQKDWQYTASLEITIQNCDLHNNKVVHQSYQRVSWWTRDHAERIWCFVWHVKLNSQHGLILLNECSMLIRVREIEVKTITRSKHTSGAHTHTHTQHVMPRQEAVTFCMSTSPVGVKPQSGWWATRSHLLLWCPAWIVAPGHATVQARLYDLMTCHWNRNGH